jgi:hypothetical protein
MSHYDDDDWEDPRDHCEHDQYEIDILTGRAECDMCSHSWRVTDAQMRREIELQSKYYDDMERMERRQWWRDRTYPVRMFLHRLLAKVWPRKSLSVLHDDEIPF